jgi:hypothetical protein
MANNLSVVLVIVRGKQTTRFVQLLHMELENESNLEKR